MKTICEFVSKDISRIITAIMIPAALLKVFYILAKIVFNGNSTVMVSRTWYDSITGMLAGKIGLYIRQCSSCGGSFDHLYVGWRDRNED